MNLLRNNRANFGWGQTAMNVLNIAGMASMPAMFLIPDATSRLQAKNQEQLLKNPQLADQMERISNNYAAKNKPKLPATSKAQQGKTSIANPIQNVKLPGDLPEGSLKALNQASQSF